MTDEASNSQQQAKQQGDMNLLPEKIKKSVFAFFATKNVVEQQAILKDLAQRSDSELDKKTLTRFLSMLFLSSSLKNILRKTCTRLLLNIDTGIVREQLAKDIKFSIEKLETRKATEASNVEFWNSVDSLIVNLQLLFSNFPVGIEALNNIIDTVFSFTFDAFLETINLFENEFFKLEDGQNKLLNVIKFLDTILHQCTTSIRLPPKSTTLLINSYKVIKNEKITFTTKSHCGALLVMAVVQCPDNIGQDELDILASVLNIPPIKPEDNLLTAMLHSCGDCYTTRICIFSGIVHTCPLSVMSKYMVDETPVAIYIFKNMLDIAKVRTSFASEALEISRSLVALSPLISYIKIELLADMMKSCWDYIWMHLDHFVDGVRSDAQKLLKTFITITLELTIQDNPNGTPLFVDCDNLYLKMFTSAIKEIIEGQNPNFKALAHIASIMKCQILLQIFPEMPKNLLEFLNNQSVAQDVCTAYERLMDQHFKEAPETWVDTWVKPLLPFKHTPFTLCNVLRIFNNAFKTNKEVILLVSNSSTFTESELRALLGCIITARKSNVKLDDILNMKNGKPWNGINIFNKSHLQMLLCHKSPDIRLLVLTLLVECQRTTEIFTLDDFKLLLMFYKYNSIGPFPNFRQSMTALYKKALNRLKDSYYTLIRNKRREEIRGEAAEKVKLKLLREQVSYYQEFVKAFFQHLFRGLFYQAEHGKRAISLELLIHLKACLPEEMNNELWAQPFHVPAVYGALDDTYESNLIMMRKILDELPTTIAFPSDFLKEFQVMMKQSMDEIAFDVKPNVVTSATYGMLIYLRSPSILTLLAYNFGIDYTTGKCAKSHMVKELLAQINAELEIATQDIVIASKFAPIHGLLFSLRNLMEKESLDTKYPSLVPHVVEQCLKVVEVAAPIINSAAPEGYNPNNVNYEDAQITPQLVLLNAWRTIKEVSLLFGDLHVNDQKVKEMMIKYNLMDHISNYFLNLFEAAKHRGAYEQGYVGFAKLTEKLWNSSGDWAILPQKWLSAAINLIRHRDGTVCATRRSAGIPFMIQAILVTEPKQRQNKLFHPCMDFLLKCSQNQLIFGQNIAIHGMNILRALYRHNQLGEVVAPYVSKGVIAAIVQFGHSDWAIRNSATLMFAALMMRIFGVQRLKDSEEVSIKNRMAFKVFTTRYPELYKFMFAKLDEFTADDKEHISLYPILLILGRLYLTFDAKKDDPKLIEHLHSITQANSRQIYKIRELAVHASIPFETYLNVSGRGRYNSDLNNHLHGALLNMKYLMPHRHSLMQLSKLRPMFCLIREAGKSVAQTNATLLMDILIDILKEYTYKEEDLDILNEILDCLHANDESEISTCHLFTRTKFALYLHVILQIPRAEWYKRAFIVSALFQAFHSSDEEMSIFALNCIRYISSDNLTETPDDSHLEYEFVRTLPAYQRHLLCHIIRVHLFKKRIFMDLFTIMRNRSRRYSLKVCQLLYNFSPILYTIRPNAIPVKLSHQMILDYLDHQATTIDSDMFVAVMGLIGKFVAGSIETMNLRSLIDHMVEFGCDDESTVEERMSIANFLLTNYSLLINIRKLPDRLRYKLWDIYLDFMQDDEYIVRDFCNKISIRILSESTNVFPLHERYLKNFPLVPERLHEEVIARLPLFVGRYQALKIYVTISLQYEEADYYTDEASIFDKVRPNTFKESRPFLSVARHHLARHLWQLDHDLNYEDRTIFLEEHYLMVTASLLNIINQQDETDDRSLCLIVLRDLTSYLERLNVGTSSTELIKAQFEKCFAAAVQEERANNRKMSSYILEARKFLECILFTCQPGRDECKCDNL